MFSLHLLILGVSEQQLQRFKANFEADPKNKLAQNVACKYDPLEVCINREVMNDTQHVFSYKVRTLTNLTFVTISHKQGKYI